MRLAKNGTGWEIVGQGSERVRVAVIRLENGKLVCDAASSPLPPGELRPASGTIPVPSAN